jgi:hypothetical protein
VPTPPVITSSPGVLSAGLNDAFFDTYRPTSASVRARLADVMEFIPSDKESERFAYYNSPPHATIWRRGESIPKKNFKDVTWTVTNRDWGVGIDWHRNDERDDQTRSLRSQAEGSGSTLGNIPERVFFQVLTAATDVDLLPSVPNAADGSALHVTSTRFGSSGGNVITGSGVGTTAAIVADFHSAVARFFAFQDTEGQPLWDPSLLDEFVVYAGSANIQVFNQAFKQSLQAAGATTATSNASLSPIIREAGFNVDLRLTPRITTNDWFIFLKKAPKKALVALDREAVDINEKTMDNSDSARETKIVGVEWHMRMGFGVATPYQTVKIDN